MRHGILIAACVAAVVSTAHAGLVWESTFPDGDTDGVIQLRADNPNGTVMIGSSAGGTQVIRTQSLGTTESNKSGRDTGTTLGSTNSFSALYTFSWDLTGTPVNRAIESYAGFTSNASPHCTRQFLGARVIRVYDGTDHYVNIGGGFASWGWTGSGRNFPGQVNLGPDLHGRPLQLTVSYDGPTETLDVSLWDGVDGTPLSQAARWLREFGNLGVPSNDPNLNLEVTNLALTHLGWTDFIGEPLANNVPTDWVMDSLRFYDDALSAKADVVPEPMSLIMLCVGLAWTVRRRRR